MSNIVIGKVGTHNVSLDLRVLLETRMLVTADSGGGKTFLLKRLCEQLFGKVPILIVDPEGEFAPLREKFGFVLCGKGGETPADPRSAALVAHKFLELQASAICDIYEMKPATRHEWVRRFVEALIEAPKNLRHPTIVLVDEAHMFCPEKGKGESEASEAVKDLATRGRKRGLCAIFATQRLATLNKDASGMLGNRLIGPTFEDVNVKRAIEIMSVATDDQKVFKQAIKLLEPGNFYALGRAISKERVLLKVGSISTPHGNEAMKYAEAPPPAPEAIAKLLPKLSDLPKAAEEKAKTEAELRTEIRSLKTQLRTQPAGSEVKVADPRAVDRAIRQVRAEYDKQFAEIRGYIRNIYNPMVKAWESLGKVIDLKSPDVLMRTELQPPTIAKVPAGEIQKKENPSRSPMPVTSRPATNHPRPELNAGDGERQLTPYQMDVLAGLAMLEAIGRKESKRALVAAAAGKAVGSSTFEKYVAKLKSDGLVEYGRGTIRLTDGGRAIAPITDEALTSPGLHIKVLALFSPYQQKLVTALIEAHPDSITRGELGERTGLQSSSSTFEKYIAALKSAEVLEYPDKGHVKAADWLFLD